MTIFKRAYTLYVLHRYAINHELWATVSGKLALLQGLTAVEKAHLREFCTLLLHKKRIFGVQGLDVSEDMRLLVAITACLPILHLGLGLFSEWSDIIIYPTAFRVSRDEIDEAGVIHHEDRVLSGESWARGPLIIAWDEVERDIGQEGLQGHNVIIHEIAHKLDMRNGKANGMPPLHASMPTQQWSATLSAAYEELNQRLNHHHRTCVNPYAATSPAEFFAVFSEYFFCAPTILHSHFADVYRQFCLYYRQDPLLRLSGRGGS